MGHLTIARYLISDNISFGFHSEGRGMVLCLVDESEKCFLTSYNVYKYRSSHKKNHLEKKVNLMEVEKTCPEATA